MNLDKEFDERFAKGKDYLCLGHDNYTTSCSEDVKQFIHQKHREYIEKILKLIPKEGDVDMVDALYVKGWNAYRKELMRRLNETPS